MHVRAPRGYCERIADLLHEVRPLAHRTPDTGAPSMAASTNASSIADTAGLSTRVRALAQVKSPHAPLDARSSDFGISCVHEGHLKAEMRGFPTSRLRASSGAVECNRGHREVRTPSGTAPPVLPPPSCQRQVAPRILPYPNTASSSSRHLLTLSDPRPHLTVPGGVRR